MTLQDAIVVINDCRFARITTPELQRAIDVVLANIQEPKRFVDVIDDRPKNSASDDEINRMIDWLDKRCAFTEHQKDYIFFGMKQLLKGKL